MAVVINEFEVMTEAAPAPRSNPNAAEAAPQNKEPEPSVTARALHALEKQSLRVWAH